MILHIFRKDFLRLRWEIAVSAALLAFLAHLDSQRADFIPGMLEGMLNLLIPAAWLWLIAMLVHGESLVDERSFWLTRPYRRVDLLLAKVLWCAVFIHGAMLVADLAIVTAKGFPVMRYLPSLFTKQLLLACTLTLPGIALASVTRNMAQFATVTLVIVGVIVTVQKSIGPEWMPWLVWDYVRRGIPLLFLVLGSLAMVWMQYARRVTLRSRVVGIAAVLLASAAFALLPPRRADAIRCRLQGPPDGPPPTVEYNPSGPPFANRWQAPAGVTIAIPISVPMPADGRFSTFSEVSAELSGAHGQVSVDPQSDPRSTAWLWTDPDTKSAWQLISVAHDAFARVAGSPVAVAVVASVSDWRRDDERSMPAAGGSVLVPGNGRCRSDAITDFTGREMLKVSCEVPGWMGVGTSVRVVDPATGREWKHTLGDSYTPVRYPSAIFLSPLDRRQTFFHLMDSPSIAPQSRWIVPRETISRGVLYLAGRHPAGCRVVKFELRGVELARHVVRPGR